VELFFCFKKGLVERGKAKELVCLASVVLPVHGGRWISVEWHWGCGVGVAAEGFAAAAVGGGPLLFVTAVLCPRWFPIFPSFFFASFSLGFGSD
jgi:hypothetical protein